MYMLDIFTTLIHVSTILFFMFEFVAIPMFKSQSCFNYIDVDIDYYDKIHIRRYTIMVTHLFPISS